MNHVEARKMTTAFLKKWVSRVANRNGIKTTTIIEYIQTNKKLNYLNTKQEIELYILVESIKRCSNTTIKYLELKYMEKLPLRELERAFNRSKSTIYRIKELALYEFALNFYQVQKELNAKNIIDFRHRYIKYS